MLLELGSKIEQLRYLIVDIILNLLVIRNTLSFMQILCNKKKWISIFPLRFRICLQGIRTSELVLWMLNLS